MTLESNLTTGNVARQLVRFSIPILLSNMLQAFYSVVDMIVVGNFIGSAGLSAINIGGQITIVVSVLCIGLCIGTQVVVGQYFGADQQSGLQRTIGTTFSFCILLGILIPAVGIPLISPLLRLLNTPPEAFTYAKDYTVICLAGTFFVVGYHAVCSILRGMGDSRRPFYFIAAATTCNIILDLIFVGPLHLAAVGAAWATVLSQGLAFVASLLYLHRKQFVFQFRPKNIRISGSELRLIVKIGVPSALQVLTVHFSLLFVTALINRYGVAVSAAAGVGMKIETFAVLPHLAVSSAVSAMVAQNMGAEKPDRARLVVHAGLLMSVITSAVVILAVQLFPAFLVGLFDTDPAVISSGVLYLRIVSIAYLFGGISACYNGLATGVGHSVFALGNAMLGSLFLRVGLSYLLNIAFGLGLTSIYWSMACAPSVSALAGALYFYRYHWETRRLTGHAPDRLAP